MLDGEVSFGRNNFVYDNKFLQSILNDKVYKNTVEDLTKINLKNDLDKKLDELNNFIETRKIVDKNIVNFIEIVKENNLQKISTMEFRKLSKVSLFNNIDVEKLKVKKSQTDKLKSADILVNEFIKAQNIKQRFLEKEISKLLSYEDKINKNQSVGELVLKNSKETLKYLGTPVELKKIRHALKEYFVKTNFGTEDDINYTINSIIDLNVNSASQRFYEGAINCFYQEYLKEITSKDLM